MAATIAGRSRGGKREGNTSAEGFCTTPGRASAEADRARIRADAYAPSSLASASRAHGLEIAALHERHLVDVEVPVHRVSDLLDRQRRHFRLEVGVPGHRAPDVRPEAERADERRVLRAGDLSPLRPAYFRGVEFLLRIALAEHVRELVTE